MPSSEMLLLIKGWLNKITVKIIWTKDVKNKMPGWERRSADTLYDIKVKVKDIVLLFVGIEIRADAPAPRQTEAK